MGSKLLRPVRIAIALLAAACGPAREAPQREAGPLVLYVAGSLTRPLKVALDSFARLGSVTYQLESAGSLETARKLTELGKIPDIVALADAEVFPQLLVPKYVSSYATFATNRMVLAKSPRAKYGDQISSNNWWEILQRPGVEVGRADPAVDPAGYRTLLAFQLTEREQAIPGLARALEGASPRRNVRPKSAELTALVQAGEFDYAWEYESVARAAGLAYVTLSPRVDLGSAADSLTYAMASARVPGATMKDSVTVTGAPIRYALAIPKGAPHPALAGRFVRFLASPAGKGILRREFLPALDNLIWTGGEVPPELRTTVP